MALSIGCIEITIKRIFGNIMDTQHKYSKRIAYIESLIVQLRLCLIDWD